ncbi:ABC transporter substrate-binding protein [Camelimonas abortus]|uniref:ABC transporter substrate-binding protein n=1 Tax=Camelimonas abortus TaxID=1017184 RepID=A0ABV7LEP4_9HYPH
MEVTRRAFQFGALALLSSAGALAWGARGRAASGAPGVTDTEIRLGQTMPYSGPAAAWSAIGRTEAAYYRMINDQGGVNGRRINLISLDDAYSPPKTVEATRRLVEQDEVFAIVGSLGTAPNAAIHRYLNSRGVPQLLISSGISRFNDPKNFPWTMPALPSYLTEARILTSWAMRRAPGGRIGLLMSNDDLGRDALAGARQALGPDASRLLVAESYELTDASVDSQILKLKSADVGALLVYASPKFAAQTIRKLSEMGWRPLRLLSSIAASVAGVLQPAGLENSVGVISVAYVKDPTDPAWENDPGMKRWHAFMDKYLPGADKSDLNYTTGYYIADFATRLLKACGDRLTRENLMRHAANVPGWEFDTLIPGIRARTTPDDFAPLKQMQMMTFDGRRWNLTGELLGQEG